MNYDIVIIGGGTSGIACAYIAGKLGLKTLVVEKNSFLGGSMTGGLVIPSMKTIDSNLNTEFLNDFYNYCEKYNCNIEYFDKNKGWFNPELVKIVFDKMLQDKNVDVIFNVPYFEIIKDYNLLKSIKISSKILSLYYDTIQNEYIEINSKFFVDATGDAILSRLASCYMLDEENQMQSVSLRFIMSGVDVKSFVDWILTVDTNRNVTNSCIVDDEVHVTTAYTWDTGKKWGLKPLFERALKDKVLEYEDTSYFQLFSIAKMPGSIAFNCPRIISNMDKNSIFYESNLLKQGREQILRLSYFLKTYFNGFQNSYISNIATQLGVRKSWQVKTVHITDENDLCSTQFPKNPVLKSDYPIDIHSDTKNNSILNQINTPYYLSLDSLKSSDYKNLFVVGRCLGASFKAQAALRVHNSCFSMGEAVARAIKSDL